MPNLSEDAWPESNVDDVINYLGNQDRHVMEVAESDIPTQA
jgi:hypothetical protein